MSERPSLPTPAERAERVEAYDGFLLLGFGGPETPEQLWPYLERVTAGRGIPRERLEEVAEHYREFGGTSPINEQNRQLLDELRRRIPSREGWNGPMAIAHRNTPPFAEAGLRELIDAGCRRILVLAVSAYESYSSCRQYREDLAVGLLELGEAADGIVVDKLPPFCDQAWFVQPQGRALADAIRRAPESPVLFVTHSLPLSMAGLAGHGDGYVRGHREVAIEALSIAEDATGLMPQWSLTYSSRSGPPSQPWLEPDVGDAIRALAEAGAKGVIVDPIGFLTDHIEVTHDLDTEAGEIAAECGVEMLRVPTVGTDEDFLDGLADWVSDHLTGRVALRADLCDAACCQRGARPPHGRPAQG